MAVRVEETIERLPAVLSLEEAHVLFDREARRVVGMSGQTFLDKWDRGEIRDLSDSPEGREIAYLVLLIPFGRRVT